MIYCNMTAIRAAHITVEFAFALVLATLAVPRQCFGKMPCADQCNVLVLGFFQYRVEVFVANALFARDALPIREPSRATMIAS